MPLNLVREQKLCRVCGLIKPQTEFHVASGRSRDGFRNICKQCKSLESSEARRVRKEESAQSKCCAVIQLNLLRGQKFCCACRKYKSVEDFSMRTALHGHKKTLQRSSTCKECSTKRSKDWYYANTERSLSTNRINILRNKVVLKLGARCANPACLVPGGCTDLRALQIDHVNNDGAEERKKYGALGSRGGQQPLPRSKMQAIYLLALEDTQDRYQLLCANCNVIKEHERRQEKYRQRREANRAAS